MSILIDLKAPSPEETLPSGEVSAFEECVFEDALHTTQCLDHICAVVVQVPQFAVVPLVSPPERILFQHLHQNKKGHQRMLADLNY